MKKYRIVYWLAAVCCLPLFTACNGFLREDPRDGTDHADAYRTLSDVYTWAVMPTVRDCKVRDGVFTT